MRDFVAGGYALSAVLYLGVWLRPSGSAANELLQWVSFSRLCLAEFLSVHAATLLSATALVVTERGEDVSMKMIFWILLAAYALFALGAFLMHRSHRALIGFYLVLAIRGLGFFSLGTREPDVMRAEVLKNFLMSVPMMLLVAAVSMSDPGFDAWQAVFLRSTTVWQRVRRGRALLIVSAYYLLWAFVELKWPERIAK